MIKNWRTDLQGGLLILGALGAFGLSWLQHGVPPSDQWAALWAAIMGGIGLIRAADGKVVSALPPPPSK